MKDKLSPYLSFLGALGATIILITVVIITRLALPFIYENLILYPLIKFFIFGGITYAIIKSRRLDADYLLPRKKIQKSIAPFLAIITSLFLVQRVATDMIDFLDLGMTEFIKSRNEGMYTFNIRGIKHFISLVIVGPIVEEIMFRGLIFRSFLKHYDVKKSIILSSFLFAFPHVSPDKYFFIAFLFSFFLGTFLCWVLLKTENFKIVIGCHMFWNFINYFLLSLIFAVLQIRIKDITDLTFIFLIMITAAILLSYFGYRRITKRYPTA